MASRSAPIAALLLASAAYAADAPKPLLDKLRSIAGATGEDCGVVLLKASPDAAFACAERAGASGKPYRLALEFEGTDGPAWQGAARDAQGRLWAVYFDSDPAAEPGTGNTLSVVPCSEIKFNAKPKGDDAIQCQPILGRR